MYHDLDTWVPNDILIEMIKYMEIKELRQEFLFLDKNIIENYLMVSDFKKYGYLFKSKNLLIGNYKNLTN